LKSKSIKILGGIMKFEDYNYQRIDMEKMTKNFKLLLEDFKSSKSFESQDLTMQKINQLRNQFETMATIVSIRHSIDTTDEFYDSENEYYDNETPNYQALISEYYELLTTSIFRRELENKWGKHLFNIAELQLKTFAPEIIPDLQEENKLASRYGKLLASAKIEFEGKTYNLSQMTPHIQSVDRKTRKKANQAVTGFFEENEKEFDDIYEQLVSVRQTIAEKLGYENYIQLGYDRLGRTEYGPDEVEVFREQVKKSIVPIAVTLRNRQSKRLDISELLYYDENLEFTTGNATPKGDKEWMVKQAKTMYTELSEQTKQFFDFMIDRNLMDLDSKPGKRAGGYCTYIPEYASPFIFANFNGTSHDVDVLTHEAGHAFQIYSSKEFEVPEYYWPTLEACEIHSMSMEFITWPWMKLFFEQDEVKYKFSHLASGVLFIPYGVLVDEFQHYVYAFPKATKEERKQKWRELESVYLPTKNYSDNAFLDRGTYWYRQGHIFNSPFYYIDYTLAQICAYQFWIKFNEDKEKAWQEYHHLCKAGGSKPFLELLGLANLKSPFESETIDYVAGPINEWLEKIDDKKL
jgi:M3 family oligoendopeptidase